MWRLRLKGTKTFWKHRGGWLHEECGFDTQFLTLETEADAEKARSDVAKKTGLSADQIEPVRRYGNDPPELEDYSD